jgi:hypothetical protein
LFLSRHERKPARVLLRTLSRHDHAAEPAGVHELHAAQIEHQRVGPRRLGLGEGLLEARRRGEVEVADDLEDPHGAVRPSVDGQVRHARA